MVDWVYWPIQVKDVYSCYRSYHLYQLKVHRPIKMKIEIIQTLKSIVMLGLNWVGPTMPTCTITRVVYILVIVDFFLFF